MYGLQAMRILDERDLARKIDWVGAQVAKYKGWRSVLPTEPYKLPSEICPSHMEQVMSNIIDTDGMCIDGFPPQLEYLVWRVGECEQAYSVQITEGTNSSEVISEDDSRM